MTSSPPRPAITSSPDVPMITSSPSVPTIVAGSSTMPPQVTSCARAPGANEITATAATATRVHDTMSLRFIHILPFPCIGRTVMETARDRMAKADKGPREVATFRNAFTRLTDNGTGGGCGRSGPSYPSRADARSGGSGFGRVPDLVREPRSKAGDGRGNRPKSCQEAPAHGDRQAVGRHPEPALERRWGGQRVDGRGPRRREGGPHPGNPAPRWPGHHR